MTPTSKVDTLLNYAEYSVCECQKVIFYFHHDIGYEYNIKSDLEELRKNVKKWKIFELNKNHIQANIVVGGPE